jgi:hypothetical protein
MWQLLPLKLKLIKVVCDCACFFLCYSSLNLLLHSFHMLQIPEFVTSFFSRLSWPTMGSPPSAPTRNIVGNAPSYAGRRVEASVLLNAFNQILNLLRTYVYIEMELK